MLNEHASGRDRLIDTRPLVDALIGRGQIFDDSVDIGFGDRCSIGLDHFVDFGLPEILLEFRPARLGSDVIGGMTTGTIFLHHIETGSRRERCGLSRQIVGDRRGACRAEIEDHPDRYEGCDGVAFHDVVLTPR